MTTTDARKRNRDMADAHETARARDERAKAGHPIEWFVYDETQTFTREHLTEWQHAYLAPANPRPGDVVQYLGHATTQPRDAAWMLGALDGTSGPRDRTHTDQETDMDYRTPDQKRHDETLAALHEIRDTVLAVGGARTIVIPKPKLTVTEHTTTTCRSCGASRPFNALCPSGCDEPTDDWLDEPIPVPRPEPADITEEPPVGSQVTDGSGDIWERREVGWALWWPERSGWVHELLGGDPSPWPTVRSVAPLRPTTDADRERVGLKVDPAPADVDPDEALAKVIHETERAHMEAEMGAEVESWENASEFTRTVGLIAARAAREHIEAERIDAEAKRDQWKANVRDAAIARAEKTQADLARVTGERDGQTERLRLAYDALKKAEAKAERYDALRADVWVESGSRVAAVAAAAHGILARDDARAEGQP